MQGRDYGLCGWRVHSTLTLPELVPWSGSPDHPVDVTIRAGHVPKGDGIHWVTVAPDGSVQLSVEGVVRILIKDGCRITLDILQDERAAGWRLFLLGAGLGYLCHQRSVLPLHAACLTVAGRTVALVGESGAGKSTLAYSLVRRGHQLLSDDLTVLLPTEARVRMLPSFPRLKLWRDALAAFGQEGDGFERVRDGLDKFDLKPHEGFDPTSRSLDAIYILRKGDGPVVQPVSPVAAVPLVASNIARPWVAGLLGRQASLFAEAVQIVRHVPVMRLIRPMDFSQIDQTARLVETASSAKCQHHE